MNEGKVPTNHKRVIDAIINCRTNVYGITFTVPEEIRDFFLHNQKEAYSALFKASSDSIKESTDKSRTMKGSTKDFFLPIFQLSVLCKKRFKKIMKCKDMLHLIPPVVWDKGWNVNIQSVGSGRNTIKYLSRYVFKVAISDYRIIKVGNRRVYFKYRSRKTGLVVTTSLDVIDFIKRYLLHVLPSGFMKVRYYGFMHTSFHMDYKDIRLIIEGLVAILNKPIKPDAQKILISCRVFGKEMKFMFSILPNNIRIRGSSG